jgi:hypothetical protein
VSAPCEDYFGLDLDELPCEPKGLDLNDADTLAAFEWAMTSVGQRLHEATGGVYGVCTTTIRPPCVRSTCHQPPGWTQGAALPLGAGWDLPAFPAMVSADPPLAVNCWHACNDRCSSFCGLERGLSLPLLPVVDVTEIKIDGVALDPAEYRLVPGTNVVVRLDGDGNVIDWPVHNDWLAAPDAAGTWTVTWSHGIPLPEAFVLPMVAFAAEMAKSCIGETCQLPEGVIVVSRPGVTYALLDDDYRRLGLTGWRALDDVILTFRGGTERARERPRMWRGRRRSSTIGVRG